jgi:hypothetical protein
MRSTVRTPTLKLATARLEFSSDRRVMVALNVVAVTALVCLVVMIGSRLYADSEAPAAALAALRRQDVALQAELSRARIELELERSTRTALARQVTELTEETSELKSRLDFFNAQSGRPDRAR